MIRVIIVDDIEIIRESLKLLISRDWDIDVVACAASGKEAFELCGIHRPDVVLMDIAMPLCDGVKGTSFIKSTFNDIKVIMLTTVKDDINIAAAIKNGASGYLLKDISSAELIEAIKNVVKGFRIIHDSVFDTFINSVSINEDIYKESEFNEISKSLSNREKEIIRLTVDGKSYQEIAAILFISEGRVRNIVSEILKKLELRDRLQLAVFAVKNKLI
jgi:RNA polymerase sigma factor (sigma-70 family)